MANLTEQERQSISPLYLIEVLYYSGKDGTEVKKREWKNRTGGEMMRLREEIFSCGVAVQVDPKKFVIIPPGDIKLITVIIQEKYYDY